MMAISGRNM